MTSSLGAVAVDLIADGTTATNISCFMNPARFVLPGQSLDTIPLSDSSPAERS
jgi:sarcosine oxidase